LLDEGVERLRKWFSTDLEFEQTTERLGKPLVLGGHPAVRIVFRGEVGDVMMTGECFMVAHQGIAYWLTTWAPEVHAEQVFDEWERLREGFAILKDRDGWQEKQPKKIPLLGTRAPYELTYTEGLWEKRKPVDYGADVDAALHGRDEMEPTHGDKTATGAVAAAAEGGRSQVRSGRSAGEPGAQPQGGVRGQHVRGRRDKKTKGRTVRQDEVGDAPGRLLKVRQERREPRRLSISAWCNCPSRCWSCSANATGGGKRTGR
jgi:hypothetical protein